MLLTLPSYSSQLGVVERFMKVTGREEYPEGAHFQFIDQRTLMQVMMYEQFLRSEGKELENIIAWYFNDYLKDTFSADGFSDTPDAFILLYFAISCSESCIVIAPVSAV